MTPVRPGMDTTVNGTATVPPAPPRRFRVQSTEDRLFEILAEGQRTIAAGLQLVQGELAGLRSDVQTDLAARAAATRTEALLVRVLLVGMLATVLLVGVVGGATVAIQTGVFSASVAP